MEPLIELTESVSWNRAYTASFDAEVNQFGAVITPIGDATFDINSHGLVIGVRNGNAPSHWRLGAWVSITAPRINTGSTTFIGTNVEVVRTSVLLNVRHLIRIPYFGIPPYRVRLSFPRWHSTILIESWWLDDERVDPLAELVKDVRNQL